MGIKWAEYDAFLSLPYGWSSGLTVVSVMIGWAMTVSYIFSCKFVVVSYYGTEFSPPILAQDVGEQLEARTVGAGLFSWLEREELEDFDGVTTTGLCTGYNEKQREDIFDGLLEAARALATLSCLFGFFALILVMGFGCFKYSLLLLKFLMVALLLCGAMNALTFLIFESNLCTDLGDPTNCKVDEGGYMAIAASFFMVVASLSIAWFAPASDGSAPAQTSRPHQSPTKIGGHRGGAAKSSKPRSGGSKTPPPVSPTSAGSMSPRSLEPSPSTSTSPSSSTSPSPLPPDERSKGPIESGQPMMSPVSMYPAARLRMDSPETVELGAEDRYGLPVSPSSDSESGTFVMEVPPSASAGEESEAPILLELPQRFQQQRHELPVDGQANENTARAGSPFTEFSNPSFTVDVQPSLQGSDSQVELEVPQRFRQRHDVWDDEEDRLYAC